VTDVAHCTDEGETEDMKTGELWSAPVELCFESADHFESVRNCREALACLGARWPAAHDETFASARKKCLMAIERNAGREQARDAFIRAAKTAGLLRH
jgi:hypothetical protein